MTIILFESSVILEGSKTGCDRYSALPGFESSVILEGSKTKECYHFIDSRLRVVLF